jgi:N-acetylglucosamine kinase-like BadF-type ATPase
VRAFLGIDAGGTKTDFLLIEATGRVLASHRGGPAYYLETGLDALQSMLVTGIQATLRQAAIPAAKLEFAFIGLPAYGEDSALLPYLDRIAVDVLSAERYRCGNDMVCAWAGALGGRDGITIVAGTGSIAYGEFATRSARAGGWGELFSDEGSAYWIAREALTLFSKMSDGRLAKGPLYNLIRERFRLDADLNLCRAIYGPPSLARSELASLAPLVAQAADQGDCEARRLFEWAAQELAAIIHAVRDQLDVPRRLPLPVSYSGGLFRLGGLLQPMLHAALSGSDRSYEFVSPQLPPAAGAALHAAKLAGSTLTAESLAEIARSLQAGPAGKPA